MIVESQSVPEKGSLATWYDTCVRKPHIEREEVDPGNNTTNADSRRKTPEAEMLSKLLLTLVAA